jgi:hypothetical protein
MNTLVALTSTAVDLRVPTKLALDTPPLCCCLRVLCDAWLRPFALTGSPQLQRPYFWNQFNSASQSCWYCNILPRVLPSLVFQSIANRTLPMR